MPITRFNIRVYILLLDESRAHILLSDEIINGEFITKFPGGGLEYGEGILDCLHREANEELGQDVEVIDQFYTSEDFQPSRFSDSDQIICVYYQCLLAKNDDGRRTPIFRTTDKKFDFLEKREREESFRWQALENLQADEMTLPLDRKIVLRMKSDRVNR